MSKISLYLSYSNLASAIGMISVIVMWVVILLINKPISVTLDKIMDENTEILGYKPKDILTEMEEGDKYNLVKKGSDVVEDISSTYSSLGESYIYGPNFLLRYYAIINLIIGLQFIAMGVLYIMSEKGQYDVRNIINKCFKKME